MNSQGPWKIMILEAGAMFSPGVNFTLISPYKLAGSTPITTERS